MSTFSPESLGQLESAGVGAYKLIAGIAAGRGPEDLVNLMQEFALAQACVDEIRADNDKAIGYILGSALRAHGAS